MSFVFVLSPLFLFLTLFIYFIPLHRPPPSLFLSPALFIGCWLSFSLNLTHNPLCLPRAPASAFASLKSAQGHFVRPQWLKMCLSFYQLPLLLHRVIRSHCLMVIFFFSCISVVSTPLLIFFFWHQRTSACSAVSVGILVDSHWRSLVCLTASSSLRSI